jgi:hemerythrin
MAIQWRPEMKIDGAMIDDDHRHLIDIINRMERLAPGSPDPAELMDIVYALKLYAGTHFQREERLQRLVGYPEASGHHVEHADLLARLDPIIGRAQGARSDPAGTHREVGQLLRAWLLQHIIKSDFKMRPYAEELRRHEADQVALRDALPGARAVR